MPDETRLKSAYELAMERLKQKDVDAGVVSRPLTDADKAAIAEIRNFYEAKIAEQQVMLQSRLQHTADFAERNAVEAAARAERERYTSERDRKIEKIRNGGTTHDA
jgi:exonuclease I